MLLLVCRAGRDHQEFIRTNSAIRQALAKRACEYCDGPNRARGGRDMRLVAGTLLMAGTYEREPCWVCGHCGQTRVQLSLPRTVSACGRSSTEPLGLRLELLRLASRQGAAAMVVKSDKVLHTRGVHCMRRYWAESPAEPLPRRGEELDLVA